MPCDLPLAIDKSRQLRSVDQANRPRSSVVGRAILICHAGSKRWWRTADGSRRCACRGGRAL